MSDEKTTRKRPDINEAYCPQCGAECAVDWEAGTATCGHCGHVEEVSVREVSEILEQRRRIAAEQAEQASLETQAEAIRARVDDRRDTRETAGCILQLALAATIPPAVLGVVTLVASTLGGDPVLLPAVMDAAPAAAAGANLMALRKGWEAEKIVRMNGIGFLVTSMLLLAAV